MVVDSKEEEPVEYAAHSTQLEEDEEEELRRAKMRRRTKKIGSDSDENEEDHDDSFSDDDGDDDEVLYSDSTTDSDSECCEDAGRSSTQPDAPKDETEAVASPHVEIPAEIFPLLPTINILTNWFRSNVDVVQIASSKSARSMWPLMAEMLNIFKQFQRQRFIPQISVALEEDWKLSVDGSELSSGRVFPRNSPVSAEITNENLARIDRILQFGVWLTTDASSTGIRLEKDAFSCVVEDESTEKNDLMRNMATLWLKSEVENLEEKLDQRKGASSYWHAGGKSSSGGKKNKRKKAVGLLPAFTLPFVYIVPDVTAMTEYHQLMKRIVKSKKVIVVVPDVVISEMDQLKVGVLTSSNFKYLLIITCISICRRKVRRCATVFAGWKVL